MTDKQRQLAEDNHNLIFQFAKTRGIDLEEYYGDLAIALCKAAMSFDSGKGAFSTLAFSCMENEMRNVKRYEHGDARIPNELISSYNIKVKGLYEDEEELINILDDPGCLVFFDGSGPVVEEFIGLFSGRRLEILLMLLDGMNGKEIAKRLGCSSQYIYEMITCIRKQWDRFEGGGKQ